MPQQKIRNELLALERSYWRALQERDSEMAAALSQDPCVVVGAQGVQELSADKLEALVSGASHELQAFTLEDMHLLVLAEGVAALIYKVSEDLVVDGEKLTFEAFDSSVWIRRGDTWSCAMHTECPAGDPFGRH